MYIELHIEVLCVAGLKKTKKTAELVLALTLNRKAVSVQFWIFKKDI